MKIVMKPIEMIAWFTADGVPNPVKFRFINDDSTYSVIKVLNIITREDEKLAGNRMIKFTCRSIFSGTEKNYELKYELNTCKWFLFKI